MTTVHEDANHVMHVYLVVVHATGARTEVQLPDEPSPVALVAAH